MLALSAMVIRKSQGNSVRRWSRSRWTDAARSASLVVNGDDDIQHGSAAVGGDQGGIATAGDGNVGDHVSMFAGLW